MGCNDCALRECEGRNGYIVCDIDGEDHEADYVCEDYEQELKVTFKNEFVILENAGKLK